MLRKPLFWIIFTLFTVGCALFALKFFPQAFPIANLDLQMDRQQALDSARALAEKFQFGPDKFKQAASFGGDSPVQNYVELEAGGNQAFNQMLKDSLYSPFTWQVRHFKEAETREALIRFTPGGKPYGFRVKIPEKETGAVLTSDSARVIAETAARVDWQINLSDYELIEASQEIRPSGRADHTFVYERPEIRIKDGRYRLRLVVSGDSLTELSHFIKIPEAFSRKYEEMRSANNTIATGALVAMALLFFVGGCIIGLFYLNRERWVLWRKALFWGVLVAFMQLLAGLNNFPLLWLGYDTAISSQSFVIQQIISLFINFLIFSGIFSLSFMAAESLSRRAFPHHAQFWRLWRPEVASSPSVLGFTISGYYLVAFFLAFDVAIYLFATRVLGWWTPSEEMFQPDLLANYFPWFSSLAISLQAGFWEETLFRAVPLAGAALLGQKFGHRNIWIGAALVLQALVFGAGHVNYAQQPAYARVVELIVPSFLFAGLYLCFGLLPAIVLHFAVDVFYFALPLFVSNAAGIWLDRILVLVLALIPLWIVLQARFRRKKFTEIAASDYNRAWQPPEKAIAPETRPTEVSQAIDKKSEIGVYLAGVIGLVLWFTTGNFQNLAPPLHLTRSEARTLAQQVLTEKNIKLSDSWQVLASVQVPRDQDDRFIWQNSTAKEYQDLMGKYLAPPRWRVRLAQFEGDVAERAEEYNLFLTQKDARIRLSHILPEGRPGARLTENQARILADSTIKATFGLDPAVLKFISSDPANLPARVDWVFIFADTLGYPLAEGQARLGVKIAGDQVSDVFRYIHVPEEWARQERNHQSMTFVFQIISSVIVFGLIVVGVIGSIVSWTRKQFSVSVFLVFFGLLFGVLLLRVINNWPALIANFSTAEPLGNQKLITIAASVLVALFISASLALLVGLIPTWKRDQRPVSLFHAVGIGISIGLLFAGLNSLLDRFAPAIAPFWADYSAADNFLPFLGQGLDLLFQYLLMTSVLVLGYTALDLFTNGWSQKRGLAILMLLVFGLGVAGVYSVESLPFWLISGLVTGVALLLVYFLGFRFQIAFIPFATLVLVGLGGIKSIVFNAYTGAKEGAILGLVLITVLTIYWFFKLKTSPES